MSVNPDKTYKLFLNSQHRPSFLMPWIIVTTIELVFFMAQLSVEVYGIAEADFWALLVLVFFQCAGFAYGCYIFICVWSYRLKNLVLIILFKNL